MGFNIMEIINDIVKFSPRQLEGESKTGKYLLNKILTQRITCTIQYFNTSIPIIKSELKADGVVIEGEGCCFTSGIISSKETIVSSAMPSKVFNDQSNINFNPYCKFISLGNYYFKPAIAIPHSSLSKILAATHIRGKVEVKRVSHKSKNIIVGNDTDPVNICFAHYDSIKTGAVDNASGTAVMLKIILENQELLKNNLFVFSGAEELSYDKPYYWGKGYRVFETDHEDIMKFCDQILVIDSVGNGDPQIITDKHELIRAFPLKDNHSFYPKTKLIIGDLQKLMEVYHSHVDDGRTLEKKFLKETQELLISELKK